MTSRLIEDCFTLEKNEEKIYSQNMLIFDPYIVSLKDIKNPPIPGKLIILKKPRWGGELNDALRCKK